jgi:hypothetical protein
MNRVSLFIGFLLVMTMSKEYDDIDDYLEEKRCPRGVGGGRI